jgi:hypothetical protein
VNFAGAPVTTSRHIGGVLSVGHPTGWSSISAAYPGVRPAYRAGRAAHPPCSALLRVGFAEPTGSPRPLVRSCRTVSPMPVRPVPRLSDRSPSAVCFLWHFPAGRPDWPLASTLPCGVPTFLDLAPVWPTQAAATRPGFCDAAWGGAGGHPSTRPTWGLPVRGPAGRAAPAPCLALLRVGFAEPTGSPRPLVRSYRTVAPLPVRLEAPSAVCSLWHCPAGRPDWPLASTLPCGVPTFLDLAPVWPTQAAFWVLKKTLNQKNSTRCNKKTKL